MDKRHLATSPDLIARWTRDLGESRGPPLALPVSVPVSVSKVRWPVQVAREPEPDAVRTCTSVLPPQPFGPTLLVWHGGWRISRNNCKSRRRQMCGGCTPVQIPDFYSAHNSGSRIGRRERVAVGPPRAGNRTHTVGGDPTAGSQKVYRAYFFRPPSNRLPVGTVIVLFLFCALMLFNVMIALSLGKINGARARTRGRGLFIAGTGSWANGVFVLKG